LLCVETSDFSPQVSQDSKNVLPRRNAVDTRQLTPPHEIKNAPLGARIKPCYNLHSSNAHSLGRTSRRVANTTAIIFYHHLINPPF
jgi:hypothetical protein